MEKTPIYMIFCIFVLTGVLLFVSIPGSKDIEIIKYDEIEAGEGELCKTPTLNIKCQEGLTCVVIEKDYYISGYCIKTNSSESVLFIE